MDVLELTVKPLQIICIGLESVLMEKVVAVELISTKSVFAFPKIICGAELRVLK